MSTEPRPVGTSPKASIPSTIASPPVNEELTNIINEVGLFKRDIESVPPDKIVLCVKKIEAQQQFNNETHTFLWELYDELLDGPNELSRAIAKIDPECHVLVASLFDTSCRR